MPLQVLKATVVGPYLLLAWTVYTGMLPITALWGAAALSVLPGRSFVAFAQVSIANMGQDDMIHQRQPCPSWDGRSIPLGVQRHICWHPCPRRISVSKEAALHRNYVQAAVLTSLYCPQDTHQVPELVKPLKRYAIKWHTALGLGLCAGLCLSPLS